MVFVNNNKLYSINWKTGTVEVIDFIRRPVTELSQLSKEDLTIIIRKIQELGIILPRI